jgi:HSP20 family protein
MARYLSRWDPFREVVTLSEAMDRMLENGVASRPQREHNFQLPLDAYVTAEEIVVQANMPGVKPEDVEITLEGDTLSIKGTRPAPLENVNYVLQERVSGSFKRTLTINVPVDSSKAEAHFDNGLLTLTIPKAESARSKTIQVVTKGA